MARALTRRRRLAPLFRFGSDRLPGYGESTQPEAEPEMADIGREPGEAPHTPTTDVRPLSPEPAREREPEVLDGFLQWQLVDRGLAVRRVQELYARGGDEPSAQAYVSDVRHAVDELLQFVAVHGWLGPRRIGQDGCDAQMIIALNAGWQQQLRLLPALAAAVKTGRVPLSHLTRLRTAIALTTGVALDEVPHDVFPLPSARFAVAGGGR